MITYQTIIYLFIILSILLLILLIMRNKTNSTNLTNSTNKIETYHDINPYHFHWDMFKCLDPECLMKKTKKCYDNCNTWGETGGRHNCRLRCLDYSDQYIEQLRFNNYNFGRVLPKIKYFSLLNE